MTLSQQLARFLDDFHKRNGFVPTRLRLYSSEFMMLCWENNIPPINSPGWSHTFMSIVIDRKTDA